MDEIKIIGMVLSWLIERDTERRKRRKELYREAMEANRLGDLVRLHNAFAKSRGL